MEERVEAALADVLRRVESGEEISTEWIQRHHAEHADELQEALMLASVVAAGRAPPVRIGRYRLLEPIGAGGMGTVHRAIPLAGEGTAVAAKLLHPHLLARPDAVEALRREADIGKRIRHPNLVATFGLESELCDGVLHACLLMELVEGESLQRRIEESGALPLADCMRIGIEVAGALAAVHAAGTTHRDVKPSNIHLDLEGKAWLMDLGLAGALPLASAGFVGTFAYAAPEQFQGNGTTDGRTDLYALGLTLHEMATGRHRFAESPGHPPSPFLESVIRALIAPRPSERIQTAAELVEILTHGAESDAWQRQLHRCDPGLRVRATTESEFLGRDEELDRLQQAVAAMREGSGATILVEGGAGSGKSRLLAEFERALRADNAPVEFLYGSHAPAGAAWQAVGIAGAFADRLGDGAIRVEPAQLPMRLASLARRLAGRRPLVLCVEDLHFAPESELRLFGVLSMMLAAEPVLLIASRRPDGALPLPPNAPARSIELAPLPDEVMSAIAASHELPTEVVARAAGNPHFLLECARAWRETGREQLPESLTELLEARFDRLSAAHRELAEIAACCGERFDESLVASASELPAQEARHALAELAASGFLRQAGDQWEWDHHRVFELVRARASSERRRILCSRLADALLEQGAPRALPQRLDLCNYLLDAGRPAETERYLDAVLEALGRGAYSAQLIALLERVLAHAESHEPARRVALLKRYARHLHDAGRHDEQKTALLQALEIAGEPGSRAELLLSLAACHGAMRNHAEVVRVAREGLALADQGNDAATLWGLLRTLGRASVVVGDGPEAMPYMQRALDTARAAGNAVGEMQTLSDLVQLDLNRAQFRAALAKYEHVASIARRVHPRPLPEECYAIGRTGTCYHASGDIDRAMARYQWALQLARRIGIRMFTSTLETMIAAGHEYRGHYALALRQLEKQIEAHRAVEDLWLWEFSLITMIEIQLITGRTDRARELLGELRLISERHNNAESTAARLRFEAYVLEAEGDRAAARERLDNAVEKAEVLGYLPELLGCRVSRGALLQRENDRAALEDLDFCIANAGDMMPITVNATVRAAQLDPARRAEAEMLLRRHGPQLQRALHRELLQMTGQTAEARKVLAQMVRNAPREARRSMLRNVPEHARLCRERAAPR